MEGVFETVPFIRKILKYKPFFEYINEESIKRYKFILIENYELFNQDKISAYNKLKNNKIEEFSFLPVGYYKDNIFTWINNMNEIMLRHIKIYKFVEDGYILEENLQFFFTEKVILSKILESFIPCLISVTNPKFNLIRFEFSDEYIFYALISLDIDDKFDFTNFLNF